MKLRIKGGRVIDPLSGFDQIADVWVDGDRIVAVGRRPPRFVASREINASEHVVCPGFVELGAHLREPGAEHKATIAQELAAAAAGGFTTVCATPDTTPVADTPAVIEHIMQRARTVRGARVRCIGALTQNLAGEVLAEMQALKAIGCIAVANTGRVIRDSSVLKNALAYAATLDLLVFLEAEDAWLGAQGVMHEGVASTRAGLAGVPAAAELIGLARDLILVEQTGVRAHFRTLSSAKSVVHLRNARRTGLRVSADVGIAHLHLCDDDIANYDARGHVRPPLRSARDRKSLAKALAEGRIDALSSHHQPHDADAKAAPFAASQPGISGLDTFLPLMLTLVEGGVLDLSRAIAAAAVEPARILGLEAGRVAAGALADLCIFDPALSWQVNAQTMLSAGKNTPFDGRTMRGRVTQTIVGGRVVFDRDA
jgi:dihydroorotase